MPASMASSDAVPKSDLRTISVREAAEPLQRLEDLAWSQRTTVSGLVRRALRETFPDLYADTAAESRAA